MKTGKKFITYNECTKERYDCSRIVLAYLKHEYLTARRKDEGGLSFSTADVDYSDFTNEFKVNDTISIVSTNDKQQKISLNERNFTIPYVHEIYNSCIVKAIEPNEMGKVKIDFYYPKNYFSVLYSDNSANIECTFLKAVSFKGTAQTECRDETAEKPKNETDPQVWFEKNGRVILKNLIADLSSRGHNTLTVRDDGSCVVEQGDKTVEVSHLTDFPERVYYPRLIKVLAGAGIAAKSVDNGLAVSW